MIPINIGFPSFEDHQRRIQISAFNQQANTHYQNSEYKQAQECLENALMLSYECNNTTLNDFASIYCCERFLGLVQSMSEIF